MQMTEAQKQTEIDQAWKQHKTGNSQKRIPTKDEVWKMEEKARGRGKI